MFGLRDTGIPDGRLRKLGEDLQPGQALLCVLVDAETRSRARARGALPLRDRVEVELSPDSAP